ncbi:DUF2484 family protein [Primorskyibacter sp. S87]|uniref:DUF2484 family protein n=1 Tax=Primorskyibacter sp. S87 TaxID=3415126 RepID=UPI003C7D524B
MSLSVILGAIWVLAATLVALLPMRLQYVPGVILLVLAPVLIGFLGYELGWIAAMAGLAAFLSMFRNPLRYFWRRFRGLETGGPGV